MPVIRFSRAVSGWLQFAVSFFSASKTSSLTTRPLSLNMRQTCIYCGCIEIMEFIIPISHYFKYRRFPPTKSYHNTKGTAEVRISQLIFLIGLTIKLLRVYPSVLILRHVRNSNSYRSFFFFTNDFNLNIFSPWRLI